MSRVVEDYTAHMWRARERPEGRAATTALAEQLGVTASTVSATLKKLARDGFITYEPYGSISLTDAGEAVAVRVIRRHRIIESYLVECMGLSWHEAHAEADRLEHSASDTLVSRMHAALGGVGCDSRGDSRTWGCSDPPHLGACIHMEGAARCSDPAEFRRGRPLPEARERRA